MQKICVVHLVRVGNDRSLFDNFLHSYKKFSAGVSHNLLIVYKGFEDHDKSLAYYRDSLQLIDHSEMAVSDEGYDITAYFKVINRHNFDIYCFFNSYSRLMANNWLLKLFNALNRDDVGLAGATGSYQSMYRDQMSPGLMLPPLNQALPIWKKLWLWKRALVVGLCSYTKRRLFFSFYFNKFPNPHIRTNAFVISKETLKLIPSPNVRTKMDAWLFESGKKGLTKSVKKLGKKVVVVGANGDVYEEQNWPLSKTYMQNNQENLLVADNLTNVYQSGDMTVRQLHADYAWANQNIATIDNIALKRKDNN